MLLRGRHCDEMNGYSSEAELSNGKTGADIR